MTSTRVLITGGAGFVGSNLAEAFAAKSNEYQVTALDNLHRRGSELNVSRLEAAGVRYLHGDIRNIADLEEAGPFDLLIECSAEPSVQAGYSSNPSYLIETNLHGTGNCLEMCRRNDAAVIFLSTSRVYSIQSLKEIPIQETETRFNISKSASAPGVSEYGISEAFSLSAPRSLYGATKLASEILVQEFGSAYGLPNLIFRSGIIAGPWQFGKVDQGVVSLWASRHLLNENLAYKGFRGTGKQVRDILDVRDFERLILLSAGQLDSMSGNIYNVGGGLSCAISLLELTELCEDFVSTSIEIEADPTQAETDVPIYVSDFQKAEQAAGWAPEFSPHQTVESVFKWLTSNPQILESHFRSR